MRPAIQPFFDPATNTITYLVADPATGAAAIIDPVWDYDPKAARTSTRSIDAVLVAARERELKIQWALETHAHADHLTAAAHVRRCVGAKVGIGAEIARVQKGAAALFDADDVSGDGREFDGLFGDGERIPLGSMTIEVLHTPGHTPACVTYVVGDAAFVGDTIFMPDYGTARCDFPGGDAATLHRSIRRILSLPPRTRIFVGHDYLPAGRTAYAWETTVAEQRAGNIHVRDGVSEEQFVAMRTTRDATLSAPTLILPSLQVNIRAGALPPPSASGKTFLKIPVNVLKG